MVSALVISTTTLLVSVAIHLFNISVVADRALKKLNKGWIKTQAVVFIAIASQILLAAIFTLAYHIGLSLDLGSFKEPATFLDIFYFSLTTITTLGLGTIVPTGHLQMLAGVESATGFLLISCSASKVFKTM
ncbi:ion channel [Alteromonas sp. ASW11-19]|uniref:Ion channel n=1 Tax=Alteromonas salexigens TaxID=2982530 RepID=A0ABT2VQ30_9ALTE|nr:ion channel [Alteromonas salexigens]MCU7555402.1 ion channel [Alteromonas salexigens]